MFEAHERGKNKNDSEGEISNKGNESKKFRRDISAALYGPETVNAFRERIFMNDTDTESDLLLIDKVIKRDVYA